MADVSTMQITVRAEHAQALIDNPELGEPDYREDNDDGTVTLTYDEIEPCVGTYKSIKHEGAHIPFTGSHGSGYDYGEARFCSDGKRVDGHPTHAGSLMVVFDEKTMAPDPDDLAKVVEFVRFHQECVELLTKPA